MNDLEIYEKNLLPFKIVKRYGTKAQCRCPAHDDKQASLTITKGRKCTLFYCHAGCAVDAVLTAAGIEKKDTFYDVEPRILNWKAYIESREKQKIEAVYNYVSINGAYAFTKVRMQGKKMIYGTLINGRFTYGLGGRTRKELCAVYAPDGVQAINKAVTEGRPIFIPEGEKDVDTLIKQGYTAFTYGGCSDWQSDFATLVQGAEVFILADNDEAGKRVAETIQNDIKAVAKSTKIIVPMPDVPKADITDYFNTGRSKQEFGQMLQQEQRAVKKEIVREGVGKHDTSVAELTMDEKVISLLSCRKDSKGDNKVLQTVKNFEIALENDRRFTGKIRFDEFSQQTFLIGDMPWESRNNYRAWSSFDDSALFSILQSDYGLNSRNDYFDALKNVSMRNKFHPVRDMLDSLKWNGEERLCRLIVDYLGAEDTEYTHQATRLWMLGGVARIYQPGCKFDYILILMGPQGIGKSTFLLFLALNDIWFNDSLDSLDSDKAAQSLMGSWIIELAELKSLARTAGGVDSVKRFLTSTQDKYRIPYEKRADVFPRQCIFAGTTNRSDFLQDETGNRRFLIVPVGITKPKKNLFSPDAMEDIKSAWAEAVHIWKTENPKLILPDSCRKRAEELQAESMADDGKIGIITEYLENKQKTCAVEIWNKALNEVGRPQKWQASEINTIVSGLPNWIRMSSPTKFGEYGSQRGFQKVCSNNLLQNNNSESGYDNKFVPVTDQQLKDLPFT